MTIARLSEKIFSAPKNYSGRYEILDIIRGANLIFMIFYHALWDIFNIFGIGSDFSETTAAYISQQISCQIFILLSGFCRPIGKHPLKRGITVFLCGALISAVTCAVMPENRVLCGILTFLGSAMLLTAPFDGFLKKLPPLPALFACLFLFLFTKEINYGYLGFESIKILRLPGFLYRNLLTAYIGFPEKSFSSTDYFSIFPWIFLFLAGYFLFFALKKRELLFHLKTDKFPFLQFMGRHSLVIYVFHQPVLYLILRMIFRIMR